MERDFAELKNVFDQMALEAEQHCRLLAKKILQDELTDEQSIRQVLDQLLVLGHLTRIKELYLDVCQHAFINNVRLVENYVVAMWMRFGFEDVAEKYKYNLVDEIE